MAQEFCETLAGTKSGMREARKGLRRLYQKWRALLTSLFYARVTYGEYTHRDGIKPLENLANDGDLSVQADTIDAWGKSLSWLGAKKKDLPLYDM